MQNTIPQLPSEPTPNFVGEPFALEGPEVDLELQRIEIDLHREFGPTFVLVGDGRIVAIGDATNALEVVTQDTIDDFYLMLTGDD